MAVGALALVLAAALAVGLRLGWWRGGVRPPMVPVPVPLVPDSPLQAHVRQQVGPYRLYGAHSSLSGGRAEGLVDGVVLQYEGPGDKNVDRILMAWESPAYATESLQRLIRPNPVADWKVVRQEEVRDPQGQLIGRRYFLRNDIEQEAVGWTEGSLCTLVLGPQDRVPAFYEELMRP